MEGERPPLPVPRSRFRQFRNPPQPHMCIADSVKDSSEKLYINVLGWQKIPNPKQYSDPIPLYGGMKVPQGCISNNGKSPVSVFAVMVNPEILKINGKNAANPSERDALVSLMCDFVEAMNPGLQLARQPVVLAERDLAGELKDVWLAVQAKRDREKGANTDYVYKVYDIDGVTDNTSDEEACEALSESREQVSRGAEVETRVAPAGGTQCRPLRDPRDLLHDIDYYQASQCGLSGWRPTRERPAPAPAAPPAPAPTAGNGQTYDFYPVFVGERPPAGDAADAADALIAPLHKLAFNSTDNTNCDNKMSDFSSISS